MKKYILSLVFLISFFSCGQNYVENGQSYEYNIDNIAINHVYEEGSIISPDLNKVTFAEQSGTFPNFIFNDIQGYGTGSDGPAEGARRERAGTGSPGAADEDTTKQVTE